MESRERLLDCEDALGVRFTRPELLDRALTHASRRASGEPCNERMEFVGDAILGMVLAEYLFRELPDRPEGELTRIRSVAVSTDSLASAVRRSGLERFVKSGRGVAGRLSPRVAANIFEAIVAAIYLDQGLDAARAFVLRQLEPAVHQVLHGRHRKNYKSLLQVHAQRHLGATPTYRLLDESGPEHGKRFLLAAIVGPREFEPAWGNSKKEAEQQAARNALGQLGALGQAASAADSQAESGAPTPADSGAES